MGEGSIVSKMKGRKEVEAFLNIIRNERCQLPPDLHVTRMCGGLVAVSNGHVINVANTEMNYCPLSSSLYDCMNRFETCDLELKKQMIATAVESKITRFGHFTAGRELQRCDVAIPFGASEMIMYALERKGIDVAVTVCDGAGTVITQEPSLVQGIGARMNGLFYTSPIHQVIDAIEKNHGHVLSPKTALIDQVGGVRKALEMGYRRIAVTVNGFSGEDLNEVRNVENETDATVNILVVCTTGVDMERVCEIGKYADLVWSCASFHVRDIVGRVARLQIGVRIPVFVLTRKGIEFVANYSSKELREYIEEGKRYVIMGHSRNGALNCRRIRMGNFETHLGEIDELPLKVDDEPRPLI
jgi:putative methanogenesis marker protein 8